MSFMFETSCQQEEYSEWKYYCVNGTSEAKRLKLPTETISKLNGMTWTVPSNIIPTEIMTAGSYGVIAIGKFIVCEIQSCRNINAFSNQHYDGADKNLHVSEELCKDQYYNFPNLHQFCIKRSLDLSDDACVAKSFLLELELMKSCNHPNIISLNDSYFDEATSSLTIVMPKANCDLHQALYLWDDFQLHSKTIVKDVLRALLYLHHNEITHRDLSLTNIFIFYNANQSIIRACIGDLGMACVANSPEQTHQFFTTHPYRAPELFYKQGTTNPAVDIWSLGCIIAEIRQKKCVFSPDEDKCQEELMTHLRQICALVPPHEMNMNQQVWIKNDNESEKIFNKIQSKYWEAQKIWSNNWLRCTRRLVETDPLLRQCWQINPDERIGIEQICVQCDLKVPKVQLHKISFRHEEFIQLNVKKDILHKIKKVTS